MREFITTHRTKYNENSSSWSNLNRNEYHMYTYNKILLNGNFKNLLKSLHVI